MLQVQILVQIQVSDPGFRIHVHYMVDRATLQFRLWFMGAVLKMFFHFFVFFNFTVFHGYSR